MTALEIPPGHRGDIGCLSRRMGPQMIERCNVACSSLGFKIWVNFVFVNSSSDMSLSHHTRHYELAYNWPDGRTDGRTSTLLAFPKLATIVPRVMFHLWMDAADAASIALSVPWATPVFPECTMPLAFELNADRGVLR